MAVNHSIRSGNLQHLVLLRLYLLIFLFCCPWATPLSFEFPSFNQTFISKITTEGAAFIDKYSLRLTNSAQDETEKQGGGVGRAYYTQPFLLRENATGKLADFTTNFTFSIYAPHYPKAGDGLTFFLAPNGSKFDASASGGAALGLPFDQQYPFVAVEFDIYMNTRQRTSDTNKTVDDPSQELYGIDRDHVGIDVNSVKSLKARAWNGSIADGENNTVQISYNSSTKNLSVAFTTFMSDGKIKMSYLSYTVDLEHTLPDWVIVGFSASTGADYALHKIVSWNFNSTPLFDKDKTPVSVISVPAPSPVTSSNSSSGNKGLVVGLGVGAGIILVGGLGLVWFMLLKKKESMESDEDPMVGDAIDDEFAQGSGPRKFLYSELVRATGDFDEVHMLGQGGFGGVYKGFIKDLNLYVAVKRISKGSKQGMKEYATEVRIISRLRHRNLVQLIGWCHKEKELLLVYEFMPNCSLDTHLFKQESLLIWETRYKIAQGLATGLLYLHEEWEQCVLHRDIKSSNVMLDSNFNVKLGDFGLAQLVDHGKPSQTTVLAGTMGYMAPECVNTGKASKETDIYSFGIVALEIACGRRPIDPKLERHEINIVEWVWRLYGEGRVIEAADPKLCGEFDEKQLECLMIVGLWCAHPDYMMRPSIQQAIKVLNFEVPEPILPSTFPVATYFASAVSFSKFSDNNSGSSTYQSVPLTSGGSTFSSQVTTSSTTSNPSLSV